MEKVKKITAITNHSKQLGKVNDLYNAGKSGMVPLLHSYFDAYLTFFKQFLRLMGYRKTKRTANGSKGLVVKRNYYYYEQENMITVCSEIIFV